jgi:hypothetical protein
MSKRRLFSKIIWAKTLKDEGKKAKRLNLKPNQDGVYFCPVDLCESNGFNSKRGCRKHVHIKHGWYYFFDEKPDMSKYFPELSTNVNTITTTRRGQSSGMPCFVKTCEIGVKFSKWLSSLGGGGKSTSQSEQTAIRALKYLKFCCSDQLQTWELPESVVEYCMGSVSTMSEFIEYIQAPPFKIGNSGTIGYMNSLSHLLDFCRANGKTDKNIHVFIATEVFLDRVKKCLKKKVTIEWNTVLSLEYLSSINCWATLEEMQKVVPFHENKFNQIISMAKDEGSSTSPHDLTFATSYVICVLFLVVKGTRPMTYQYLTTQMIKSLTRKGGVIDSTKFKTAQSYGFDSLVFNSSAMAVISDYELYMRPQLNPQCNFLLVSRNGTQLKKLGDIFGRMVFQAIGKYIHPTRYRQIVETESSQKLTPEEQSQLSMDQKHTSRVAKVHYKKMESQKVAMNGHKCMQKLLNNSEVGPSSSNEIEFTLEEVSSNDDSEQLIQKAQSLMSIVEKSPEKSNKMVPLQPTVLVKDIAPKGKANERGKMVPFTKSEDNFLRDGIKKYGKSWTKILRDDLYRFNRSRKTCTLLQRAKVLGLIKR